MAALGQLQVVYREKCAFSYTHTANHSIASIAAHYMKSRCTHILPIAPIGPFRNVNQLLLSANQSAFLSAWKPSDATN